MRGEDLFTPEDKEDRPQYADDEREAQGSAEGRIDATELTCGEVLPDDSRQSFGDARGGIPRQRLDLRTRRHRRHADMPTESGYLTADIDTDEGEEDLQ